MAVATMKEVSYLDWNSPNSPNLWYYGSNLDAMKDSVLFRFSGQKIFFKKCNTNWDNYENGDIVCYIVKSDDVSYDYYKELRHSAECFAYSIPWGTASDQMIRPRIVIVISKWTPKDLFSFKYSIEAARGFYWRYNVIDYDFGVVSILDKYKVTVCSKINV